MTYLSYWGPAEAILVLKASKIKHMEIKEDAHSLRAEVESGGDWSSIIPPAPRTAERLLGSNHIFTTNKPVKLETV
ncbi:hypothetical protein GDO78_012816 [Eleutherodactylus coqui]|uniref:Uncharacterized protein n=1 Tax=Eleutherodactylus coqui TaxID=57060 RepID=A0A8J6K4E6_ELECQ|nr:hypothetical protein GDO78_012816 [Eleutherodactylus coqui]